MKRLLWTLFLAVGGIGLSPFALAQGGPPSNNIIDGTRYPDGYTPMPIKNGNYPRRYTPNTEKLGPKEMRITALGTGMPNVITGSQKASGWFVELGNYDDTLNQNYLRRSRDRGWLCRPVGQRSADQTRQS